MHSWRCAQTEETEKIRIVAFGGSITAGFDSVPYSFCLQQQPDANGCNSTITNQVMGGRADLSGSLVIHT